jgi:glycosyltransferase involved in cell wall biosynthesis
MAGVPEPAVRAMILLPTDLAGERIGGIHSFLKAFIKFAPHDFAIELVGSTSDATQRTVGRWQEVAIEGRPIHMLPVIEHRAVHGRSRVPLAVRYAVALWRRRRSLPLEGRVLQFHRPGVPLALRGRRAPRIQVVHLNVADLYGRQGESRWRLLPGLFHRVEGLTLPTMDRIFVVNQAGADVYRHRYPALADRIAFLPTWVDDDLFGPVSDESRRAARDRLADALGVGIGDDRLLVFAGRLEPQKDPELLIEAFGRLASVAPASRLLVVGEGSLRGAAEIAAGRIGLGARVHFMGSMQHEALPAVLQAADAFVLASRFEGMPIAVLEALACGLPVAAPDVGEVGRVVIEGQSGALAPDRSVQALADAMARAVAPAHGEWLAGTTRAVDPFRARAGLAPFFEAHYQLAGKLTHAAA